MRNAQSPFVSFMSPFIILEYVLLVFILLLINHINKIINLSINTALLVSPIESIVSDKPVESYPYFS